MKVIEHRPYDHKADVFSFGIVLWELISGQVGYSSLGVKCVFFFAVSVPFSLHFLFLSLWRASYTEFLFL